MSKNTQLSNTLANAQADALARLLDNGYLRIYNGSQPANANSGIGGATMLVELRFAATSAPAASGGVLTFNSITSVNASASGTATWFRCFKSDGTTVVMDGSVDTSGANMNFNSTAISSGALINVTGFTHSVLESTAGD